MIAQRRPDPRSASERASEKRDIPISVSRTSRERTCLFRRFTEACASDKAKLEAAGVFPTMCNPPGESLLCSRAGQARPSRTTSSARKRAQPEHDSPACRCRLHTPVPPPPLLATIKCPTSRLLTAEIYFHRKARPAAAC